MNVAFRCYFCVFLISSSCFRSPKLVSDSWKPLSRCVAHISNKFTNKSIFWLTISSVLYVLNAESMRSVKPLTMRQIGGQGIFHELFILEILSDLLLFLFVAHLCKWSKIIVKLFLSIMSQRCMRLQWNSNLADLPHFTRCWQPPSCLYAHFYLYST